MPPLLGDGPQKEPAGGSRADLNEHIEYGSFRNVEVCEFQNSGTGYVRVVA
jgi:hypothetical protein